MQSSVTPWYRLNERRNAAIRAFNAYLRAVKNNDGIAAAHMALLRELRDYENGVPE